MRLAGQPGGGRCAMTSVDSIGYVAASLVLATFCARTMVLLRALAIASNLAFIAYGLLAHLWPILLLHAVMLPLNVHRLLEVAWTKSSLHQVRQ
jgi:CRP/FNR family transcriptional regulator, cyclic AMP receptor protein